MKATLSPKSKKSLAYSIFIVIVLGVFSMGYLFYYMPKNKAALHRNGFLILKTIAENLQSKNDARIKFYGNISQNENNVDSIRARLIENKIDADVEAVTLSKVSVVNKKANNKTFTAKTKLMIKNNNWTYGVNKEGTKDSFLFTEPIAHFIEPLLVTQKDELFQYYILLKADDTSSQLLYHDPHLSIRSDVKLDSLLPRNVQSYLSGIQEQHFGDQNNLMFYSPLEINDTQMVLCGFVASDRYNTAIRLVPFYFVYPLAMAFILLLFFMPILKFYIMDSNEQVRMGDVLFFGISVFMTASLLTLFIIQYFLWRGEEHRVAENLESLSNDIEKNFSAEINKAYAQLEKLDVLKNNDEALQRRKNQTKIDYSAEVQKYLATTKEDLNQYYFFDRVSWIDNTGMQVIKGETSGKPVFTNVKDRQYYKAIMDNSGYYLAAAHDSMPNFSLEPIYSWTNADFNITISKKTEDFVAALASKMQSVIGVVMPLGYGFCIIDSSGVVQLHSDNYRNLRENIYEKASPSIDIQKGTSARQITFVNDVMLYSKLHMMRIAPLKNLPYSIVTFYDKRFIIPVNLRILIFALLFCLLSGAICFLLWLSLARFNYKQHPLLYCSMDCFNWIAPQKKEATYYFHAIIYLTLYLVLFIFFIGLYKSYNISNFTVFSLVMLTPFNIIFVLFALRAHYYHAEDEVQLVQRSRQNKKVIYVALIHAVVSIAYFCISKNAGLTINLIFLILQGFFILWSLVYRFGYNEKIFAYNQIADYRRGYSIMATLLVICLAVIPSGLFTWYAHNQEIIQTVKKRQLHLATDISSRMEMLKNRKGLNDTSITSYQYIEQLLLHKGVYTTNNTALALLKDSLFNGRLKKAKNIEVLNGQPKTFEPFYFAVTENISASYFDPQIYPALNDFAADSAWRWQKNDSIVRMWYYNPFFYLTNTAGYQDKWLQLSTVMPERFRFLKWNALLWLAPLIFILVFGLYKWLKINLEHVFLIKFLHSASNKFKAKNIDLIVNNVTDENKAAQSEIDFLPNATAYIAYTTETNKDALNAHEMQVLEEAKKDAQFYTKIWESCSEKERYLLFDFAQDGLINYKNTAEIYHLITKGIFIIHQDKLRLFSAGFRAFLITKSGTDEINELHKMQRQNSTWQALKTPFMIIFIAIAVFIFFTQETAFQKILALAGGLGTLLTLLPKIFTGGSAKVNNTV